MEKGRKKTIYWYQKAAENGNEVVMYNLPTFHQYGEGGIEKNLEKAIYWYKKQQKMVINLYKYMNLSLNCS